MSTCLHSTQEISPAHCPASQGCGVRRPARAAGHPARSGETPIPLQARGNAPRSLVVTSGQGRRDPACRLSRRFAAPAHRESDCPDLCRPDRRPCAFLVLIEFTFNIKFNYIEKYRNFYNLYEDIDLGCDWRQAGVTPRPIARKSEAWFSRAAGSQPWPSCRRSGTWFRLHPAGCRPARAAPAAPR